MGKLQLNCSLRGFSCVKALRLKAVTVVSRAAEAEELAIAELREVCSQVDRKIK